MQKRKMRTTRSSLGISFPRVQWIAHPKHKTQQTVTFIVFRPYCDELTASFRTQPPLLRESASNRFRAPEQFAVASQSDAPVYRSFYALSIPSPRSLFKSVHRISDTLKEYRVRERFIYPDGIGNY